MTENMPRFMIVTPDPFKVLVVERKRADEEPEYQVHGETRCALCNAWCWLGNNSLTEITAGRSTPWCQQCAADHLPPGSGPFGLVVDQ